MQTGTSRSAIRELVRRGVPQVVGVYLAAGWGLLEFSDWVAERFRLGSGVTDLVIIFLGIGLPLAVAWAWQRGGAGGPPRLVGREAPADRSIAVLPFVNLTPDDRDDYLGSGLTDEIIFALTRISGLKVASRTSSMAFQGHGEDVRSIGEALNVESVLEGTVQRFDDRVRVCTRLIDVKSGYHLWSDRFDRELEDFFAIEDEIARSVARALRVILRAGERRLVQRGRPTDVRAYEFYLRGQQFFRQIRRKSLEFARDMFERAVEIDPGYARAWAGIAEASAFLNMYYPTSGGDLRRADDASRKAVELAPGLAEARSARGFSLFLLKRPAEAEQEFREAIELDPRNFDAWYFHARACFQQGRFEEAGRMFEEANRIRTDYQAAFFAAQSLEALGREAQARTAYQEALETAERHMEFNPDDARAATMQAVSLCRLGKREEGLAWAERALAIDAEDAGVRYNVACLYALGDDGDRAIECLREVVSAGFGHPDWIARDPDLASLRSDPRFQELLETH